MGTLYQQREGTTLTFDVDDHRRDLSGTELQVALVSGNVRYVEGKRLGKPPSETIHFSVDLTKAPPGAYDIEVCDEHGNLIYPPGATSPSLQIIAKGIL